MIDRERLLQSFLALARISSPSGQEAAVAAAIIARLAALGIPCEGDAHGNLLARVPGEGEPLLVTAHMDTVVPCENVQPVVRDGVVYSDGSTILGADDKAGVAMMLEVAEVLQQDGLAHRPLELLFTVREEIGLEGARLFDKSRLRARQGIGLDAGGDAGVIVVSAPSQDSLYATVRGRTAHAGSEPENGVNAIVAAARGIACMPLGAHRFRDHGQHRGHRRRRGHQHRARLRDLAWRGAQPRRRQAGGADPGHGDGPARGGRRDGGDGRGGGAAPLRYLPAGRGSRYSAVGDGRHAPAGHHATAGA